MKLTEFEQHIKTQISSMEEEVDISQIMSAIHSKKKKNRTGIYVFGFAFLFAIVGLSYFYIGQDANSLATIEDSSQEQSKLKDSEIQSMGSVQVDKSIIRGENSLIVKQELEISEPSNENISTQENILQSIPVEKKLINTEKQKDRNSTENNFIDTNNSIHSQNIAIETTATVAKSYTNEIRQSNLVNYNQKDDDDYLKSYNSEIPSNTLRQIDEKIDLWAKIGSPKEVLCPSFLTNEWQLEVGMVMGVSNPNKLLTIKNPENISAFTSRAKNEKSLEGLDLEFFISAKRARWPIFIKTGLNYSRWSERMIIDKKYTEIDTVIGIISTTVSQTGDTITTIYGDIYVQRDYEIKKNVHYYLHRFDIPVSVVYEQEFGNHAFQTELGTRVNFSTLAKGNIYNQNEEFSSVSNPGFFKKITGLSYFTKLHYRYYLNNSIFVGASAYYHLIPADFSSDSNGISQEYTNFGCGISTGLRF